MFPVPFDIPLNSHYQKNVHIINFTNDFCWRLKLKSFLSLIRKIFREYYTHEEI